jgi:hypothetical protein
MPFLQDVMLFWVRLGVLDVVLPFLLIFTVLYAVLNTSKILGEKDGQPKKRLNAVVAVSVALLSVAVLSTVKAVTLIAQYSALALVIIVLFWILSGLLGIKGFKNKHIGPIIGMLVMGLLAVWSLGAWGWIGFEWLKNYVLGPVIIFGVLVLLVWYITREK